MKSLLILITACIISLNVTAQKVNNLIIHADSGKFVINENIYGHFAEHLGGCVYDGIWVGEESPIPNTRGIRNDVVEALKEIEVPVLRWPGGCFADIYHWQDGVGPRENRKPIVNKTWGGVMEDNSFGTHEFLDFCSLIGAEPYLAINVGSGTVQEAAEWIDYVNATKGPMAELRGQNGREEPWNVKYWGIGNESWGCGGHMNPDFYANLSKQYSTFCSADYKILSGGTSDDLNWTETIMRETKKYNQLIQGYSYHYYTICHNWSDKGSATDFNKDEWFSTMKKTLFVRENLKEHIAIMDKYDPGRKIALIADEWGNWFNTKPGDPVLFQQNTLRDALTAGLYLNIFNNHAERVKMANLAQTVNVLQSVVLTKEEKMVKTPTFYVFKMYKAHQNATLLPFSLECKEYINGEEKLPALHVSASLNRESTIHISVINLDPENSHELTISVPGKKLNQITCEIITAGQMNALNDFNKEEKVNIQPFRDFKKNHQELKTAIPAKSIVMFKIRE